MGGRNVSQKAGNRPFMGRQVRVNGYSFLMRAARATEAVTH